MVRAVLADLHLGQAPGDLERFAVTVAEVQARGVGEVVFLGDLFRTLVGFSRFWDQSVEAGLAQLARLRTAGARVVMVEGNRDFFLDAAELAAYRDGWGMAHSFTAGGRRFLLEHGDLVNRHDRAYRWWRSLSKSAASRLWARSLPAALARSIVHRTEARLAQTNFSYRREVPEEDLGAAARRHFAAGVDVVLWGHFHRPWQLKWGEKEAHVLGGWCETGTVVTVGEDGTLVFSNVDENGHFVDTAGSSWYQGRE
ncbi:MAG: UDP-2,3-diacylglucosamine diphosphatase [Acidobacteriota bacterium]